MRLFRIILCGTGLYRLLVGNPIFNKGGCLNEAYEQIVLRAKAAMG